MTKVTSKLLTLLLTFSMVFTTFGFVGTYEVNASEDEPKTLSVMVVDQEDAPLEGIKLYFNGDAGECIDLDPTSAEGLTSYTLDLTDGVDGENDYELILDDESAADWTIKSSVTFNVVLQGGYPSPEKHYISLVNGANYDGSQITMVLGAKDDSEDPPVDPPVDPMAEWTEKFDFNTDTSYDWASYGIDYTTIDFDKDLIVDVRNTTKKDGAATYIDLDKDPHFVFSNPDAVDVSHADIAEGDEVAQKLDKVYQKADAAGKRVVIICYTGNKLAKRAMQYYNTQGRTLGPEGRVTYLKGGAKGVLESEYKANLGIGFNDITANDVILDVRSKENFDKGHLPGAVHVDVTDEGGKLSDKDKTDMAAALAKVPSGARLVIVCNSGNSLAYKAMAYFMADKTSAGLENLKKVTYLIGGDKVIPADKKVTTEEENKPKLTDGQTATIGGSNYQVVSASAKTAALVKAANKKSLTVPATVTVNGEKLDVVKIAPKAFKGTKVKTLTVKTKKLTKKSVKGSLKGSKVKTVKVKVGKKKVNKKYVKKYKKIFTKKNAGKKVKVK